MNTNTQSKSNNQECEWEVIRSYYSNYTLSRLQIDSYNNLIQSLLPDIISDSYIMNEISSTQTCIIKFDALYIDSAFIYDENRNKQYIYPDETRLRDLTYETSVCCDVYVDIVETSTNINLSSQVHRKVDLFKLPVMLRSSLCQLSPNSHAVETNECENELGGYFIIKGKERVLIAQERINYNDIYTYEQKNSKYSYVSEIRSIKEDAEYSVLIQAKLLITTSTIVMQLPYIYQDVPLGVVFIAMGVSYDDIYRYLGVEISLQNSEYRIVSNSIDMYETMTQDDALLFVSQFTMNRVSTDRRVSYTKQILENELFPHLGICSSFEERVQFLSLIVRKLIDTITLKRPLDDRDHICKKRIEMSGDLIGNLVRGIFKRCLKSIQQYIEKKDDLNIIVAINRFNMTQRLYHCFTTGNWGLSKSNYIRQGVSQILNRLSYLGTISHLRRVVVPIGKESRNTQVRQLHSTTYGFICAVETPEGASSGIIKNFALLTQVSQSIDTVLILDMLQHTFPDRIDTSLCDISKCRVMLNGLWISSVSDASILPFVRLLQKFRDSQHLPYSVSISYDSTDNEIRLFSDAGRLLRPVFKADPNLLDTLRKYVAQYDTYQLFPQLVRDSVIVYIDGAEAEFSYIGMNLSDAEKTTEPYDYYEIHPSLMFGISASLLPFPDHSQSPRNIYGACMAKQAIGMYALSYRNRYDTMAHVLDYPQKRIVSTNVSQFTHCDEMPSGINCIVAVMTYTGFNQEDSVILNKSAIDRGLFCSTSYKNITVSEHKRGSHYMEVIEIPPPHLHQYSYNYSKLSSGGIVPVGAVIEENDILVGKVLYEQDTQMKDCSVVCKSAETGIVDSVFITTNANGYKHIKIKVRKHRIPEIGDKLASIPAQKGTIGMIYPQEDMPFTMEGIVPDIILNVHAIPSRMTINMLMELISGKTCSLNGTFQDATAFCHPDTEFIPAITKELESHGYDSMGWEHMRNGMTGETLKAKIFIGCGYYQRLKHLVSDKCHSRAKGNIQLLSRQPCAGRSRHGGLRFGEMEVQCMIAHGSSIFLKERLFDMSDPYTLDVCPKCGTMVNNKVECMMCKHDSTTKINIPYACKLLFQELQAMGIKIMLKPES